MRAAVYREPGLVEVADFDQVAPGPRDVVVSVEACGVCGSDVASYAHGHYVESGQVMGHELTGLVAETGPLVADLPLGTRVVVRPMRSCGDCGYCRSGHTHLCAGTAGRSLGYGPPGGFAERVVVTDAVVGRDVYRVPDTLQALDAMWAEPLAVALHAVRLAGVPDLEPLVVLGGGSVGLCVAAAALTQGWTSVVVVEPREERRRAAIAVGAEVADPAGSAPLPAARVVVDCSGSSAAIAAALARALPGGRVVLVGLGDAPVPWDSEVPDGPEVVGSFAYTDPDFADAVDLIVGGRVRLGHLVTAQFGLDRAGDALEASARDPRVVKSAITPNGAIEQESP